MQREYRSSVASVSGGITVSEINASFQQAQARYLHRLPITDATRNALGTEQTRAFLESNALQSSLVILAHTDVEDSEAQAGLQDGPFPVSSALKRGTLVALTPAGGYPVMLGTTYNAQVGIKTPAQHVRLTADTGSTLTWAVLASCPPKLCPDSVTRKAKYNPKLSTTAVLKHTAGSDHEAYGDGEADFSLYFDTVTFLPYARKEISARERKPLVLPKATVGGATKTFPSDAKLDHDGLLGLGRKRTDNTVTPVLNTLAPSPLIVALEFGPEEAWMEIGGFDVKRYPDVSYFELPSNSGDDGWTVSNVSLSTGPQSQGAGIDMLIDSGSSVIIVPQAVLDSIMNRPGLGAVTSDRHTEPTIYSLPCSAQLGIQFVLPNGKTVDLADDTLLMKSNDATLRGDCLSMIVGTTNPFLPSVAGIPLLRNLYTVLVTDAITQRGQKRSDWIGLAPLGRAAPKPGI